MHTERFNIVVDYVLGTGEERTVQFAPEEYFDLDGSEDEADLSVDFTPKHQEVRQYLSENINLKQSRVRVSDTSSGDVWEVTESYWSQSGDECISVTVSERRNGARIAWKKKFIHIRFSDGRERVLVLVPGEEFPLVDSYVVVDNDELQGTAEPERSGLFRPGIKNERPGK